MRSSIACVRCRRSKVKCVNNGVGTTCRGCENSGRECTYPWPIPGVSSVKRRDSLSARLEGGSGDGERRQRARKSTGSIVAHHAAGPARESPRPLLDALDPRVLKSATWQKLFDVFQTHYSVDLPFIHPPTFLRPLQAAELAAMHPSSASRAEDDASARPPGKPEFLLAFLALTARFHPTLVVHHSPPTSTRPSNPLIASEYYAAAAHERLAGSDSESHHDIERVQALLMLGLHEWGMCRGFKAWSLIGAATRAAQAIGLQYQVDLDDIPWSRSVALQTHTESKKGDSTNADDGDEFIQEEIRRRTFWSCYIMERFLSSGKYRPQMLHAANLRIQLPVSERSFLFADRVRTLKLDEENTDGPSKLENYKRDLAYWRSGRLGQPTGTSSPDTHAESENEQLRIEVGADEGLVSRYIKVLDIYGRVLQWACAGGRKTDQYPPWDSRSSYSQLRRRCLDFKASLPRQHTLTPQHTQAHISLKTSTPYMLVHFVYLLCQIILNREYLPFVPLRSSRPEGPVDVHSLPRDRYDVPDNFWEESARECFEAAREIVTLARSCQEWSALVGTPVVSFATYTAALIGVYCINFPWMDANGNMCTPTSPVKVATPKPGDSKGFDAAKKALEILASMRPRVRMAEGWLSTIGRTSRYYRRIKSDFRKDPSVFDTHTSGNKGQVLPHKFAEDLEDVKLFEQTLRSYAPHEGEDVEMTDAGRVDGAAGRTGSSRHDGVEDLDEDGSLTGDESVGSDDGDAGAHAGSPTGMRPHSRSDPEAGSTGGPWNAINSSRHGSISTSNHQNNSGGFRSYESYQPVPTQPHHHGDGPTSAVAYGGAAGSPGHVQDRTGQSATSNPSTFRPVGYTFGDSHIAGVSHSQTSPTAPPPYSHHAQPAQPDSTAPHDASHLPSRLPPSPASQLKSSNWPAAPQHPDTKPVIPPHTNGSPATATRVSTNEQREACAVAAELSFTADDLVGFVEGCDLRGLAARLRQAAAAAAPQRQVPKGWLEVVWY